MVHHSATLRCRRLVEYTVFFLTGLVFFNTWFVAGVPVACRVEGGSMAPAMLGSHIDFVCPQCRFSFACDARELGERAAVACPNCAASFKAESPLLILSGDRVLIDRSAFEFRRPRRWEVVAFDREEAGEGLTVKRVVGLPGEKITIIEGRVYADGTLLHKDLRQQKAMRILVNDDDYAAAASRWQPEDFGSNWTRHEGREVHSESPNVEIGWLVYNHKDASGGGGNRAVAVTDYSYYNRGRMQQRNEDTHPTPDLAMSFRLQDLHGRGFLSLRTSDGRDVYIVQLDPSRATFSVSMNGKPVPGGTGKLPGSLVGETVEVSLIGRQFLLAIGSKTLFSAAIDMPGEPPLAEQPLAIGVEGLGVALDRLRVYRDIYYVNPHVASNLDQPPPWSVGADEYFVLGDNSPISEDSRTWPNGGTISHKSLTGKPFAVIYRASTVSLGGWHIQVPDLGQMRYIR